MSKVLLVATFPVFPAHSGAAERVAQLARAMRDLGHEVHFALATGGGATPDGWAEQERGFGRGRVHLLRPVGPAATLRRRLKSLAVRARRRALRAVGSERRHHRPLDAAILPGWRRALRRLADAHGFDAVVVEFVFLSGLLGALPRGTLRLIDTIDVYADRHLRMRSEEVGYGFFSFSTAAERRGLARADRVLAIQDEEARHFREQLGGRADVLTVSHVLPPVDPVDAAPGSAAMFVGSLGQGNLDALRWFVDAILPLVRAGRPDFELHVAGGVGGAIGAVEGVRTLGRVDDLRAAYARAPLLLSPTRIGTGVAIKALEAQRLGVPVVATETGARGRPSTKGMLVTPDRDAPAFAAATLRVLGDGALHAALRAEGVAEARAWNAAQVDALAAALAPRRG